MCRPWSARTAARAVSPAATPRTSCGIRPNSRRKARCTVYMSETSVSWAFAVCVMALSLSAARGTPHPQQPPHSPHTSALPRICRRAPAPSAAVGYFGTFIYRDGEWRDRADGPPELVLDIHDSDIATVDYRPAPPGLGRFYLGIQPRDYFEDADASRPVDVPAEVDGFVSWALQTFGRAPLPEDVRDLVAETGNSVPDDDFVEDTAAHLIQLLGLPLPPALAEVTGEHDPGVQPLIRI